MRSWGLRKKIDRLTTGSSFRKECLLWRRNGRLDVLLVGTQVSKALVDVCKVIQLKYTGLSHKIQLSVGGDEHMTFVEATLALRLTFLLARSSDRHDHSVFSSNRLLLSEQ